jgi:hypothetical protein
VRRSFKFLPRPTSKQPAALVACLEDHRRLYDAASEHRRTAYAKAGVTVRHGGQPGEPRHIRADDPDGQGAGRRRDRPAGAVPRPASRGPGRARWSFSSQQATLRRPDKREGSRWLVVLSCDDVAAEPLPATESAGRELIAVNPAGTSRTCARCGPCARENRLTEAGFGGRACGHTAHADVNAAVNILRAGLALRDAAQAAWREAASFTRRRSHDSMVPYAPGGLILIRRVRDMRRDRNRRFRQDRFGPSEPRLVYA